MLTRRVVWLFCALALAGCPAKPDKPVTPDKGVKAKPDQKVEPKVKPVTKADDSKPGEKKVQPPLPAEQAPAATARKAGDKVHAKALAGKIDSYFAGHVGTRIYIQVDKPLYKPGETIWIRTWDLRVDTLASNQDGRFISYQLVSPKGAVVLRKRVQQQQGLAHNDFIIPEGVQGGEYKLRAISHSGTKEERAIIVSTYEPPRVKKKLEFLRKAYGAGDEVSATIEVKRPTGEPLKQHALTAAIRVDNQDLPRVKVKTNEHGGAVIRFTLPKKMELGDGLLTVLVEESGVTESVSKRIPIVLKKVQLAFFPEGGQLVASLPTRVYFEAKNMIGKPADIEGFIQDDHGVAVAKFRSYHEGRGRFELVPATGRSYKAIITRPVGVVEQYSLPLAMDEGCVLNSFDDVDGQEDNLRVSVRCQPARTVTVTALQREYLLDSATVEAGDTKPAVVYLKHDDVNRNKAQGVARVTVFDADDTPLAERLIYRNRRTLLNVKVEPHKKAYTPREQVTLAVTTSGQDGKPIPAELALSVVDDTVISFADDKTGHMLSRLYLEQEIPGKVEEPKVLFDLTEKKAAVSLDLLMGTRGWRKFAWKQVLEPPPPPDITTATGAGGDQPKGGGLLGALRQMVGGEKRKEEEFGRGVGQLKGRRARAPAAAAAPPPAPPQGAAGPAKKPAPRPKAAPRMQAADQLMPAAEPPLEEEAAGEQLDNLIAGKKKRMAPQPVVLADRVAQEKQVMKNEADKDWAEAKEMKAKLDPADDAEGEEMGRARRRRPIAVRWAAVRVFPAPTYAAAHDGPRSDFRETIHWAPRVTTGKDGKASVSFYLSDAVTSFRVFTEGVGDGLLGRDEKVFKSSLPFSMSIKLPLEVSAGDKLKLPLTLTNETNKPLQVKVAANFGELLKVAGQAKENEARSFSLPPNKGESIFYELEVTGKRGKSKVLVVASAGQLTDEFKREVTVVPVGFPQEVSFSGEVSAKAPARHEVDMGEAVAGSVMASIRLYPSPVASMISGLDGMLRQPSGCFEQASSSNYPNVMVMRYLKEHDVDDVALLRRSKSLLDAGYNKLVGYESPKKGYEWFGGNPGHEALTAYGLLEFVDMKAVHGGVDEAMINRTAAWLKGRRDGKGGFKMNPKALDSFGRASAEVTAAYIVYSLTEAGITDIPNEIAAQARLAAGTQDPYLLSLAANTLLNVPNHKAKGKAAAGRLAAMQAANGSFPGASHSITRSGGQNLTIETTSLAIMALIKGGGHGGKVRGAIKWLNENRGGYGQWGATQATVLGLKALLYYVKASRQMQHPGKVTVKINGKEAEAFAFAAGRREPILFSELSGRFTAGKNTIEVLHKGQGELPYSVAISYRSARPASSDKATVSMNTALQKEKVKMGESVRMEVVVKNKTDKGQPMTLARVGLPGGLTFQTWQLKELRDKKLIAFYETRAREVILYFRQLKPNEERKVPIDLVATVPGEYTGPASSAYLYYTDEFKTWNDPAKVVVEP